MTVRWHVYIVSNIAWFVFFRLDTFQRLLRQYLVLAIGRLEGKRLSHTSQLFTNEPFRRERIAEHNSVVVF